MQKTYLVWLETPCISSSARPQVEAAVLKAGGKCAQIRWCAGDGNGGRRVEDGGVPAIVTWRGAKIAVPVVIWKN